jgi:peptidoglycan hydrolase-like protein with peptidoglycan-binding domain
VRSFQVASGLPATGEIDVATWPVLLRATPIAPDWTAPKDETGTGTSTSTGAATAVAARASGARVGAGRAPWSARLKARRYEIPGGPRR